MKNILENNIEVVDNKSDNAGNITSKIKNIVGGVLLLGALSNEVSAHDCKTFDLQDIKKMGNSSCLLVNPDDRPEDKEASKIVKGKTIITFEKYLVSTIGRPYTIFFEGNNKLTRYVYDDQSKESLDRIMEIIGNYGKNELDFESFKKNFRQTHYYERVENKMPSGNRFTPMTKSRSIIDLTYEEYLELHEVLVAIYYRVDPRNKYVKGWKGKYLVK